MTEWGGVLDCQFNSEAETCTLPMGELVISIGDFNNNGVFGGFLTFEFTKSEKVQACVDFLSSDIYKNVPSHWWADGTGYASVIGVVPKEENPDGMIYWNDTGGQVFGLGDKPVWGEKSVLDACSVCENDSFCYIIWYINVGLEGN